MTQYSSNRPIKIRKHYNKSFEKNKITPYSEEALAFLINTRMTKDSYNTTRLGAKQRGANIYPSFDKVRSAKLRCYPDGIKVSEVDASIPLQHLLDHTINKLLQTLDYNFINHYDEIDKEINFICKWGCDGSSGYNEYHQCFSNDNEAEHNRKSDASVFLFSLVPLRLTANNKKNNEQIILWENPKPSSIRYCRPIKFIYTKVTPETTRTEVQKVEQDIENLQTTEIVLDHEKSLTINYTFIMTMIDGKVINVLTDTSSQKCFICQCNPKAMNDLENLCNFDINM